jgi:glycosyltransferase involved in cell wall biosynthesis
MKKKIVHVISTLNPNGAERLVVDLVIALKEKGIHCIVVTLFTVPHGILSENLNNAGIQHICLGGKTWRDLWLIFKLHSTLVSLQPAVIHSHLFPPEYFVPLAAPRKIPLIHTEHSVSNKRRSIPVARIMESIIYKRFKKIVCISGGVKNSLDTWAPSIKSNTVVINNGVHLDKFKGPLNVRFRKTYNIPESSTLICMIGRFEMPPKDQETIIRSLNYLPGTYCILAGTGPDLAKLQKYASDLNVESRVIFPGYVQNVNDLLKSCNIYVYSSYHEGFGLAVIEAMAAGIPVIASDVDALNTLVEHDVNGLLFTRGNEKELADSIGKVTRDQEFRQNLIQNGYETSKKYSFEIMVNNYMHLYRNFFKDDNCD